MSFARILLGVMLLSSACTLISCDSVAGGGGSTHSPPAEFAFGSPITIQLELETWGGDADASSAYEEVKLHYRIAVGDYAEMAMDKRVVERSKLLCSATLPAIQAGQGEAVEYYFTFLFDGVRNERGAHSAPYRVPLK